MKFKIEGSILTDTIKSVQRMTNAQMVSFEVQKNFLKVIGTNAGNSAAITCPITNTGKSEHTQFSLEATPLLAALTKRSNLDFEVIDSGIKVQGGKYNLEMVSHQHVVEEIVPESVKADKALALKATFLKTLQDNLAKIELKPLLTSYDYVPMGIKAGPEGTFVACFDTYQAAFYTDKEAKLKSDLEFILPSNLFSMLAREIKGQDYKLVITDSSVYAFNDVFEVSFAIPQSEGEQFGLDDVNTLYQSIKKDIKTAKSLKFTKSKIEALLENGKSIYERDATFKVSVKGTKCKFELSSTRGKVSEVIDLDDKSEEELSFGCDFGFFTSFMGKSPSTVNLKIIKDRTLLFVNPPVIFMLSL